MPEGARDRRRNRFSRRGSSTGINGSEIFLENHGTGAYGRSQGVVCCGFAVCCRLRGARSHARCRIGKTRGNGTPLMPARSPAPGGTRQPNPACAICSLADVNELGGER
jgi:hypothetical protein